MILRSVCQLAANDCVAATKSPQKHHKKLKIMKITKITIIPRDCDTDRNQLEQLRLRLETEFSAKIYFETSGETVSDVIIEKELKPVKK